MTSPTCPHCGAEGEPYFSRLEPMGYYWGCCGKPDGPEDIVSELHKAHEELAALREQLESVTKERDEAQNAARKLLSKRNRTCFERDQWRECAAALRRAFQPTSATENTTKQKEAMAAFDKLEGGEG